MLLLLNRLNIRQGNDVLSLTAMVNFYSGIYTFQWYISIFETKISEIFICKIKCINIFNFIFLYIYFIKIINLFINYVLIERFFYIILLIIPNNIMCIKYNRIEIIG